MAIMEREMLRRSIKKVLLKDETIAEGKERRLFPQLDVSRWDRLHLHISNGTHPIAGMKVRVLFSTPMEDAPCKNLLADSTIWFEDTVTERDFTYTTPNHYGGTGFIMSVPVCAPQLYDVILRNVGEKDLESVYVTLMAQEI